MKILIYVNTKQNLKTNKLLGGVEILNYDLSKHLSKKHNVVLTSNVSKEIKNIKWDIIISSNDAKIFNSVNSTRNILWLHNKLQIEKAFRKKQLFSLLFNNIETVFVSKYLDGLTSKFYNFKKRLIISNFLPKIYNNQNKNIYKLKRKRKIVWSVQRSRGLQDVINIWNLKIIPFYPDAELHVFSIKPKNYIKYKKNNIYFVGDALFALPPSFAQGASQSIEGSKEVYEAIKNGTNNYYEKRLTKLKQINIRSKLNHFSFHLSNPLIIFLRNIVLKYLSKNNKFLEKYLGKIYRN